MATTTTTTTAHIHQQQLAYSDQYAYSQQQSAAAHPDAAMRALIASTWQVMEQVRRPPPTMNEILGAYKAKGDGDREMLLALLNAKAAEENRVAAITTLHRTLLDLYNDAGVTSEDSDSSDRQCVFPSPPSSSCNQSPVITAAAPRSRRRKSASPSSVYSSEDSLSSHPRKRHRSRSPVPREPRSRQSYDSLTVPPLDASSFPPSPYSSSSQSSIGSPRSRESMTIGALLTPHEKDMDMEDRRGSPRIRREREDSLPRRS